MLTVSSLNFGLLAAEICWRVRSTPEISMGFASYLRYCSDVAHRTSTKLCTMFGRLLGWCTIYTFSGALAPLTKFCQGCKLYFASKSCVLLYWQHYSTALDNWASAKLCGVVQGMELRNFRRGRHVYSAGRPSRWASAHILVILSKINSSL